MYPCEGGGARPRPLFKPTLGGGKVISLQSLFWEEKKTNQPVFTSSSHFLISPPCWWLLCGSGPRVYSPVLVSVVPLEASQRGAPALPAQPLSLRSQQGGGLSKKFKMEISLATVSVHAFIYSFVHFFGKFKR